MLRSAFDPVNRSKAKLFRPRIARFHRIACPNLNRISPAFTAISLHLPEQSRRCGRTVSASVGFRISAARIATILPQMDRFALIVT
jgi:hypothetical protein